MFIVNNKNIFLGISAVLIAISAAIIALWGLRFGIDFTGGSLIEVEYVSGGGEALGGTSAPRPAIAVRAIIAEAVPEVGESAVIQPTGERGYIIRTTHLSSENHEAILGALTEGGKWEVAEKRFDSVGPSVGEELQRKAWVAVFAVIMAIVLFVAFAFRKVSEPVPSWQYGVITLIALLHDVLIPTAAAAFLGQYFGVQIDVLFITALLTILGFSVHDTIVVFDRVRENLRIKSYDTFRETVGKSLEQTFMRSVNTSLTVVLVLAALIMFGPSSVYMFSIVLLIGIIAGTYSSIFLASPLLLVAEKLKKK